MLVWIVGFVIICFSAVLLVGPPYLPTMNKQVETALDMLDLKPGQTMLELGCGDGKVLIAAARRGWKVVGIELNPLLVVLCKLRTWRYRKQVTVRLGNYWDTRLWGNEAAGIFGFVLPKYMTKLDRTIKDWQSRPVMLASFAFVIPDKHVDEKRDGVFLYKYPFGKPGQDKP
jgi:cyclopropane fatty-acyl-phospholipid synthase-like methyltransferase